MPSRWPRRPGGRPSPRRPSPPSASPAGPPWPTWPGAPWPGRSGRCAPGTLLLTATPTADPSELSRQAQAARDEAAWLVDAVGEINSDAYGHVLRAGRTVLVKGAGSLHSGLYYVTRVVHRMRPTGEYLQRFEARRNAVGLDGTEAFGGGAPGLPLPGL
ncbi:hypothetical protein ACFQ0M_10270 [Kitasatospora aburaviensis]